jgi:sulfate transport system permease protein
VSGTTAIARRRSVIPGFGVTLGMSLLWLSLIVLIPLAALFLKTAELSFGQFADIITSRRVLHALQLSFGLSFAAALVNLVFGSLIVWALVRYRFPGRKLLDAIVDIPFALPTAVAGIALTNLYAESGWLGGLLAPLGIKVAFTPLGIFVALVFIGLRTVQPVLEDLEKELEEAAASLGASRWTIARRVVLPSLVPALLTGFALALARAVGEYGSVIFIAGNLPNVSEIAPLLIVIKLQEFRYADATAIAAVMLLASFLLLFVINGLQRWSEARTGRRL